MSVENAKAFLERLNSDENFRNQMASADNNEARLQIAKEAGLELSTEELSSIIDQLTSEELSEEELDTVAGGGIIFPKLSRLSSKWKVEEGEKYIDKPSPDLLL